MRELSKKKLWNFPPQPISAIPTASIVLEDGLWDVVSRSDIVYTATSSPDYVIDKASLEENGQNAGRPLMLVDIAVPRNIGSDSAEVCRHFFSSTKFYTQM